MDQSAFTYKEKQWINDNKPFIKDVIEMFQNRGYTISSKVVIAFLIRTANVKQY